MSRLKQKLKSQNGASILIALLFFLICVMVGSSILIASVSNAGKSRSNEEEHQIYLALSSAVKLVCDDIENSTYHGIYSYEEIVHDIKDDEGNITGTYTEKFFEQLTGNYTGKLGSILLSDLDAILAKQLETDLKKISDDPNGHVKLKSTAIEDEHNLTVKPDTDTYLDEKEITIKMEVKQSYSIYLTATLDDYTVYAELTPKKSAITVTTPSQGDNRETDKMEWQLGWITTEEEDMKK